MDFRLLISPHLLFALVMTSLSKESPALHMENVDNGNSNTPVGHDVEKEKKLVRKLDCVILPWVMLMYLLSYMDRFALP